jgi:hypothetical protein
MTNERFEASQWFWYSAALEESGIDDAVPGSASVRFADDLMTFGVRSRTRGHVELGHIRPTQIEAVGATLSDEQMDAFRAHVREAKAFGFDVLQEYVTDLEEKRRAPLVAKSAKKRELKDKALRLHAASRSVPYIARSLGVTPRTVQRYLAEEKAATDREPSG